MTRFNLFLIVFVVLLWTPFLVIFACVLWRVAEALAQTAGIYLTSLATKRTL
jgi:hypothetical protein